MAMTHKLFENKLRNLFQARQNTLEKELDESETEDNWQVNKINLLRCNDGKVELRSRKLGFSSNDANELAKHILDVGIEDEYAFSSSMDFASEHGFKDDNDAWRLFETALSMSGEKKAGGAI